MDQGDRLPVSLTSDPIVDLRTDREMLAESDMHDEPKDRPDDGPAPQTENGQL